uniref:Dmx like 1 n=1 Tax=Salmo trutta TaxID=8032 RepID=A0A674B9K8_SALTR
MNLHQVLTGAVNPGDNCFSVGSINNQPFTAYASGCDVVILGSDFERLQIIPGAKHGNIQVGCVDSSLQGGQVRDIVSCITCTRLLTGSASLQLWSNISDGFDEEGEQTDMTIGDPQCPWRCIWHLWYGTSKWQSGVTKLFTPPEHNAQGELDFSFVYLAHPRSVTGFSWRKTSKYMPRGSVCNVLLTCCKDSVCRLWAETLLPSDSLLSGHTLSHLNNNGQSSDSLKSSGSKKTPSRIKTQDRNPLEVGRIMGVLFGADIPLLPSITSLCGGDDEEPGGPFTVHWLNNKELLLTLAMEVFLQQLRGSVEQNHSEHSQEGRTQCFATENALNERSLDVSSPVYLPEPDYEEVEEASRRAAERGPDVASTQLPAAAVEHQVEVLLEDWNRGADMLFSIHPMDGSLLVWHVDWLDEYQPGMFRQVQVSFVSRIPVAFPTGDANSLSRSVVMYACNKNVDLAIQHGRQRPAGLPHSSSVLIPYGQSKATSYSSSLRLSIFTPNVLMISTHSDGSLNQWAVSFAEESAFSTVLSVSHKSRYCGHRFHLNDLACHSLLPLLLTTSHHNALRTPDVDSVPAPSTTLSQPLGGGPSRVSLGAVSQDPNAIYSELILWRVDPVGPLSFSGGVSELARINSLHSSAFSNVAWLPTLIPSNCLGVYCNSPSACFVASDGHSLRLYQAVIEAKKLLSELSNPDISKYVGKVFNIISQQSTAKPGCIIELDAITDFQGKETQLLHVFEEDLILGSERRDATQEAPPGFSARFFLVVVEFTQTGRSFLHMWHLQLAAGQITMGHLSASSLQPAGGAPYLLATSCSDGKVRFWRCRVAAVEPDTKELTYTWEEWPLLVEEGLGNSSAVTVPHLRLFQCESTGGSHWVLEQTLVLDASTPTGNNNMESGAKGLNVENNNLDIYLPNDACLGTSGKSLVHLDWVSREDGSHILTVGIGSKLYMYGLLSGKPPELGLSEGPREQSSSRLVLLRSVDLVSSVEGSLPIPVSLSWVRDGILVVGMDCEMHVYSQWQPPAKSTTSNTMTTDMGSVSSLLAAMKQSHEEGLNPAPPKKSLTRSMTSLAQKLSGKRTVYDLPAEMEDYGLFEAAHHLFPTLPQYHPVQLLELMDLGKVRRAKAILSHLVKCIAGEIVALKDNGTNQDKRLRSRTISAGGSTSRDPKLFSKGESSDYTEIDSIPPLPLYALLAADEDCSPKPKDKVASLSGDSGHGSSQTDAYDELFQSSGVGVDDLEHMESDQEDGGAKVIDLSQYSPTFFGPEHAQVLSSHLLHSSLPGLTRMEQMSLMALADTIATTSTDIRESQSGETLDECGLKFLLAVRLHTFLLTTLPPAHRAQLLRQGLSTCHYAWAFHSEAEDELLHMLPALQKGDPTWPELRAMGMGWWLRSTNKLRRCIEKVAKASFQRQNDPLDAAIFYLAMKKKAVVWGLYRSQKNAKMTTFFSNNFGEERWRRAALKNAFSLLGKQRFQHSAAFFLLAGSLKDAVEVCLEKMQDLQLALVISRLYESEFETSSTYKRILQRHVLGQDRQLPAHQDPFLRSTAYWVLEDYSRALDTLLEQPAAPNLASPTQAGTSSTSLCSPEVFNFYTYLRTHPLLLRRHFGSSEKTRVGLTAEGRMANSISLVERRLFFTAAYAHLQAGCPMLALEVLSKMPKVVKRSKLHQDDTTNPDLSETKKEQASDLDWSQPALNGFESVSDSLSNSQSDSVLSFDWGQPSVSVQDEALELKWDSDKEEEDDDDEPQGLAMKSADNTSSVFQDATSPLTETLLDEGDVLMPSEDILAAQLKFSACLKILTTELRTLSTGYELDGGKLRYQLCQWLEREVVALQRCCSYKPCLPELALGMAGPGGEEAAQAQPGEAQPGEAQRTRRYWLQSNQPLLRMFLSYCSLHGSHGGGLASVRMELILLLQESQQDDGVQSAVAPYLHHASIPLLLACTASAKTVVANPIVHLTNLTHDILHTINALDSPPHPDIYVMHTLAASLSACIYQCLCDGHNHSHVNQFTGIVYQSILSFQHHPVRTVSMEETVLPNTHPAQWPGISTLIRLLNSAGEESQPGLAVLLCEILTAVFLSLFVHGLATHSSNELFRIVAHPLNSKLWVAVFGGGARTPITEKPSQTKSSPGVSSEEFDRKPRRFKLLSSSSRSASREGPESPSPTSPVVEQETSIFKEHFVPPELSIWDYFIAKVPYLTPLNVLLLMSPSVCVSLLDLPVGSPLCHAVLKTLQRWEQVLLKRLEIFGGPPSKYISTHPLDETAASGPAILRHKALFEPSNTPFRSSHHSALPVKRLWQYLVKQEEVQETFIRNIFTKKRDQNESVEDHNENDKCSGMEDEADLGYPGGKARIIHKDSDIITAFAINKANRNCLVMASTHDIQELDVSSILATQILTWIDDDTEARDDFNTLHGTTPYTHSSLGTPINMPWLGGLQTGRGAAVLIKRNINNVRRMTSHPTLPYYLTGAQDGSVRMFEWGHSQQIICFRSPGNSRVTRIRFNHQGNKFGIVDADGALRLWQTNTTGNTPKPYLTLQCHNKTAHDFVFVGSSSLIATAGLSTDNRNVCLWDTLVNPMNSLVHAFSCHESGATVLSLAARQQLLITGGRKGWISVLELPHRHQRQSFQAHDSPVKALAVDPTEGSFISGSAEGNIKVWSLSTQCLLHQFPNEHARQSLFRNLGTGVMQIEVGPANHIFSCGADGTMKMRILPDRFSVNNGNLKNDVKFII